MARKPKTKATEKPAAKIEKTEQPAKTQEERIASLRARLDQLPGGESALLMDDDAPPELTERFLENVLAFEEADEEMPFEVLAESGVELPAPDELDDEAISEKLWQLIRAMAFLGIYLHHTDHMSDRELYQRLWHEDLREPTVLTPGNPAASYHIDFVSSGSEEDIALMLRYYADEDERATWAEDWPELEIPPAEKPPYDRDQRLPAWDLDVDADVEPS